MGSFPSLRLLTCAQIMECFGRQLASRIYCFTPCAIVIRQTRFLLSHRSEVRACLIDPKIIPERRTRMQKQQRRLNGVELTDFIQGRPQRSEIRLGCLFEEGAALVADLIGRTSDSGHPDRRVALENRNDTLPFWRDVFILPRRRRSTRSTFEVTLRRSGERMACTLELSVVRNSVSSLWAGQNPFVPGGWQGGAKISSASLGGFCFSPPRSPGEEAEALYGCSGSVRPFGLCDRENEAK
jgi:hypothetical protein